MREYVCLSDLRDRGWTPAMVRDLLGDPDRTAPNPHYACAAEMKLYRLERVKATEETPAWKERRAATEGRRAAGKAAADTRRNALLRQVETVTITVPKMPVEAVIQNGVASWVSYQVSWGRDADADVSDSMAKRLAVNWLRHEMTSYDQHLADLYRQVGRDAAYLVINRKVCEAISAAYPELANECDRQLVAKYQLAA